MRTLRFICGDQPNLYPFSGESFLYNSAPYLQLKAAKFGSPLTFYALDGEQAVARIHFFLEKKGDAELHAVSLPESPFGSSECGEVTYEELNAFLNFVVDELRAKNVDWILIKDCIPAYRYPGHIPVEKLFGDVGFRQQESLPNHHVVVEKEPTLSKVSSSKKRRIRLCQDAGFSVRVSSIRSFPEIYTLLSECYSAKERRPSLTKAELEQQVRRFPKRWYLFAVFDNQETIAACIAVQVNARVLYTFYYSSLVTYNFYSPTSLLLYSIYQVFCYAERIDILDPGTSNSDSVAHLKKHMGGQYSFKHTYRLKLS